MGFFRKIRLRRVHRGRKLLARGRTADAEAEFEKAARSRDPEVAAAADSWLAMTRPKVTSFQLPQGVLPTQNEGLLMALIMMAYGDGDQTEAAIKRAVARQPEPLLPTPDNEREGAARHAAGWSFHAAVELEANLEKHGRWDKAQQARSLSYTLHGSDDRAEIDLSRGKLLAAFECYPSAIDSYQQAMAAGHPQWSPIAAYDLGVLLLRLGDNEGARAAFEAATEANDRRMAESARSQLGNLRRSGS